MEEQTLAQVDAQKTQSAEEGIADFLFGEEAPEEEYEAGQEPVVEGDDSEEVEASDEEPKDEGDPEYVEVEYDGQIYEVPANLKDALLRQSDYTQKTQEVAAQRKEIETRLGALQSKLGEFEFANSIQEDVLKVQQLDQTATQYHQYLRDNIDQLSSTDIEKIRFAIEEAKGERDQLASSIQGKHAEFQQAQQQSYQELLNKGTEVLRQKIPGWGKEQQAQVRDYAMSNGFTEAELNTVVDPRHVEILYKASQYDKLKSGAAPAVKKVQSAPPIKPKARDPETGRFAKDNKLKKALKSNLSASDKASLIGDDIASRFFS